MAQSSTHAGALSSLSHTDGSAREVVLVHKPNQIKWDADDYQEWATAAGHQQAQLKKPLILHHTNLFLPFYERENKTLAHIRSRYHKELSESFEHQTWPKLVHLFAIRSHFEDSLPRIGGENNAMAHFKRYLQGVLLSRPVDVLSHPQEDQVHEQNLEPSLYVSNMINQLATDLSDLSRVLKDSEDRQFWLQTDISGLTLTAMKRLACPFDQLKHFYGTDRPAFYLHVERWLQQRRQVKRPPSLQEWKSQLLTEVTELATAATTTAAAAAAAVGPLAAPSAAAPAAMALPAPFADVCALQTEQAASSAAVVATVEVTHAKLSATVAAAAAAAAAADAQPTEDDQYSLPDASFDENAADMHNEVCIVNYEHRLVAHDESTPASRAISDPFQNHVSSQANPRTFTAAAAAQPMGTGPISSSGLSRPVVASSSGSPPSQYPTRASNANPNPSTRTGAFASAASFQQSKSQRRKGRSTQKTKPNSKPDHHAQEIRLHSDAHTPSEDDHHDDDNHGGDDVIDPRLVEFTKLMDAPADIGCVEENRYPSPVRVPFGLPCQPPHAPGMEKRLNRDSFVLLQLDSIEDSWFNFFRSESIRQSPQSNVWRMPTLSPVAMTADYLVSTAERQTTPRQTTAPSVQPPTDVMLLQQHYDRNHQQRSQEKVDQTQDGGATELVDKHIELKQPYTSSSHPLNMDAWCSAPESLLRLVPDLATMSGFGSAWCYKKVGRNYFRGHEEQIDAAFANLTLVGGLLFHCVRPGVNGENKRRFWVALQKWLCDPKVAPQLNLSNPILGERMTDRDWQDAVMLLLHQKRLYPDPDFLRSQGVEVISIHAQSNQLLMCAEGVVHWGVNLAPYSISLSVNFMTEGWFHRGLPQLEEHLEWLTRVHALRTRLSTDPATKKIVAALFDRRFDKEYLNLVPPSICCDMLENFASAVASAGVSRSNQPPFMSLTHSPDQLSDLHKKLFRARDLLHKANHVISQYPFLTFCKCRSAWLAEAPRLVVLQPKLPAAGTHHMTTRASQGGVKTSGFAAPAAAASLRRVSPEHRPQNQVAVSQQFAPRPPEEDPMVWEKACSIAATSAANGTRLNSVPTKLELRVALDAIKRKAHHTIDQADQEDDPSEVEERTEDHSPKRARFTSPSSSSISERETTSISVTPVDDDGELPVIDAPGPASDSAMPTAAAVPTEIFVAGSPRASSSVGCGVLTMQPDVVPMDIDEEEDAAAAEPHDASMLPAMTATDSSLSKRQMRLESLQLQDQDWELLVDPQAWLPDAILHAAGLTLWKQYATRLPRLALRYPIVSSTPPANLKRAGLQPIPLGDHVLQILHVSGNHWVIVCTESWRQEEGADEHTGRRHRLVLDSLYDTPLQPTSDLVRMLRDMRPESERFAPPNDLAQHKIPQLQDNTVDCGPFVIAWAVLWCERTDPCTVELDQQALRPWIQRCLQQGEFDSPPRVLNRLS